MLITFVVKLFFERRRLPSVQLDWCEERIQSLLLLFLSSFYNCPSLLLVFCYKIIDVLQFSWVHSKFLIEFSLISWHEMRKHDVFLSPPVIEEWLTLLTLGCFFDTFQFILVRGAWSQVRLTIDGMVWVIIRISSLRLILTSLSIDGVVISVIVFTVLLKGEFPRLFQGNRAIFDLLNDVLGKRQDIESSITPGCKHLFMSKF